MSALTTQPNCEQLESLTGKYRHFCPFFGGLALDETMPEFGACMCFDGDPEKKAIRKEWQRRLNLSFQLSDEGYFSFCFPPDQQGVTCLCNFICTVAIIVDAGAHSYKGRYCYPDLLQALMALSDWKSKNFEGEPGGYIVRKGFGLPDKQGPLGEETY